MHFFSKKKQNNRDYSYLKSFEWVLVEIIYLWKLLVAQFLTAAYINADELCTTQSATIEGFGGSDQK